MGWSVAKIGDRWAALEPVHPGRRRPTEPLARTSPAGLALRSDWGPQYAADAFRNELACLGITHTPSFVGEPQCNGVIERFIRTLKERERRPPRPAPDQAGSNGSTAAGTGWGSIWRRPRPRAEPRAALVSAV